MLVFENILLALTAIKSNKMRSFLTMLGIIIGISSVIAITSIGDSAKGVVGKEFEAYGMNNMYMYLNWEMTQDGVEYSDLILPEDIEALQARFPDDIKYIVPYGSTESQTKVGRLDGKVSMYGVGADYAKFKKNITILHGRMINKSDVDGSKDRIVIEKKAALNLFNKENAVGESLAVVINNEMKDLTVVGVFEVPPSLFDAMFMSDAYSTYVPYSILQQEIIKRAIELYTMKRRIRCLGNVFKRFCHGSRTRTPIFYMFEAARIPMAMINKLLAPGPVPRSHCRISLVVGGIAS